MIPEDAITEWAVTRPWPNRLAIEHDLLMARTIAAIYAHPVLATELVFRGGTCLHQVHLPRPGRYSADLDFMCAGLEAGALVEAIREAADAAGLAGPPRRWQFRPDSVSLPHPNNPKVTLRAPATGGSGRPLRVTIEINTEDTVTARPHARLPFRVVSTWFTGTATVLTHATEELIAWKLRDLYLRSKGRDLFDLWLALTELHLDPAGILDCFALYRPSEYTAAAAIASLDAKLSDPAFRSDLGQFVQHWPAGYDVDDAGALVTDRLLRRA